MANTYKDFWAYKELKEIGWTIKVLKKSVSILYKKEEYARFDLKHLVYDIDLGDEVEHIDEYAVYLNGENLEGCFDYPSDTYDQAVENALYYYSTRF